MRSLPLLYTGCPCDIDFTDLGIQTTADASKKGPVICSNWKECQRRSLAEGIACVRRRAMQMVGYILKKGEPFEVALQGEKEDFLAYACDNGYWVFREGSWQLVAGDASAVVEDVVAFARVVFDMKPGDLLPSVFLSDRRTPPALDPWQPPDTVYEDLEDIQVIKRARRCWR